MKIAIISAVFPPEPVVSARLSADIAAEMVCRGMRVLVGCPMPSRPMGQKYRELTSKRRIISSAGGVTVVRLPSFRYPGSRVLGRVAESASFGVRTAALLLDGAVPDIVYLNTWPLLAQLFTAIAAKAIGSRYVLHVQDVYPEAMTSRMPTRFRKVLELPLVEMDAWVARNAEMVVVISESMRDTYLARRGTRSNNVMVCRNWQDERVFCREGDHEAEFSRYKIERDVFTFMYCGNIGRAAGVDVLLYAFQRAAIKGAQLVIVGDGNEKDSCVELARELQISSCVAFVSGIDMEMIPVLHDMADVCLLPLRPNVGNTSVPSKMIAYLLAGKPVLATVGLATEIGKEITRVNCGWVGEAGDIEWLAAKMREVAASPLAELNAVGVRAREHGLRHYSRAGQLPFIVNAIETVANRRLVVI